HRSRSRRRLGIACAQRRPAGAAQYARDGTGTHTGSDPRRRAGRWQPTRAVETSAQPCRCGLSRPILAARRHDRSMAPAGRPHHRTRWLHCRYGPGPHRRHLADAPAACRGRVGPPFLGPSALLEAAERRVSAVESWHVSGRITRATGLVLEATGLRLAVGAACKIEIAPGGRHWADAEVVGFHGNTLYLMPQADISGLPPGA